MFIPKVEYINLRSRSRMTNNNDLVVAIRLLAEKLTQERIERLAKVKPPWIKGQVDPTFLEN